MRKFQCALYVLIPFLSFAQQPDSIPSIKNDRFLQYQTAQPKTNYGTYVLPAAFVAYGIISIHNHELKRLDMNIKSELREDHAHFYTRIDDYLQYSPAAAVYALNAFGIKGKNAFRDRTFIYALTTAISTATVMSLKTFIKSPRPDGSSNNSFPSGHTTTAFAAATFLYEEYKDVSPWYGIAGYAAAAATGAMRMYNNRHWLSDITAGAGIGILSAKLAYAIYPAIQKKLFKTKPMNTVVMPFYQNKGAGLSVVYHFK